MKETNEFNQTLGQLVADWQPVKKPAPKIMQGKYCRLEPIDISKHADKLLKNLAKDNQGESWTYLPYGPFSNNEAFHAWIEATNTQDDTELYAILNAQDMVVGICGYLRINPEHGVIEVGHLHYSALLQKTPAATEAMYLMMQYAFDELCYRRYEWKCNALNQASQNAALRLGFKFEGIFRQNHVFKGRSRDTAWFSILDGEWPAIKEKLNKWLDPNNFDVNGNQITRLQNI